MSGDSNFRLIGLAIISLIFLSLYAAFERGSWKSMQPGASELTAARLMAEATEAICSCQKSSGIAPEDNKFDINRTGLIGLEHSPLTTTLGNLEAKRTTCNPAMAALLVYLLKKAGVRRGEVVALGASASFPALIIAAYSAARALDLELLAIISVGASQWGANNPEFSWLDMEDCLRRAGFSRQRLLAVAWGGEDDSGSEYPDELKERLVKKASQLGLSFLPGGSLEERVRVHLDLFQRAAGRCRIKAFINIGGSSVNLGSDSSILKLEPGLARVKHIPPAGRRGMIQEMAARGVPVIHLLNIRRLVETYGLPWDPRPLPPASTPALKVAGLLPGSKQLILYAGYLTAIFIWLILAGTIRKKRGRRVLRTDS